MVVSVLRRDYPVSSPYYVLINLATTLCLVVDPRVADAMRDPHSCSGAASCSTGHGGLRRGGPRRGSRPTTRWR